MAYSEQLATKIRKALEQVTAVEEKKMFGGLAFMVNGKMCLTAGADRIMCRIDPALHETAITKKGCSTVMMGGKQYKGYVHVKADSLRTKADWHHWVTLALNYNKTL